MTANNNQSTVDNKLINNDESNNLQNSNEIQNVAEKEELFRNKALRYVVNFLNTTLPDFSTSTEEEEEFVKEIQETQEKVVNKRLGKKRGTYKTGRDSKAQKKAAKRNDPRNVTPKHVREIKKDEDDEKIKVKRVNKYTERKQNDKISTREKKRNIKKNNNK